MPKIILGIDLVEGTENDSVGLYMPQKTESYYIIFLRAIGLIFYFASTLHLKA